MRVYVDSNVFIYAGGGGKPPPQWRRDSRELLRIARRRVVDVVVSPLTIVELRETSRRALRRRAISWLKSSRAEALPGDWEERVQELASMYVRKGAVPPSQPEDAEHLAWATVAGADVLASWNRTHLVRLQTRRLVGIINPLLGYPSVAVEFPSEVLRAVKEK